ncbi:hypothetical protein H6A30_11360 [Bacteroides caecigallinarum]|nr:hypothetical protein [Bacteroides caecigallinarum]MBM6890842.1 hypothetical protein [Bacteroides caecigallinarum]
MLTANAITLHQRFIKPLAKRKVMCGAASVFSFHQPNPFVERLMSM